MKYLIPVVLQVNSPTASEATRLAKAEAKKMEKKLRPRVGDPEMLDGPLPDLSAGLLSFLKDEVDNNDNDVSGHATDLNYIHGTLAQMPDDLVAEQAGHVGDDDAAFAKILRREFKTLHNTYGGATKVSELLR